MWVRWYDTMDGFDGGRERECYDFFGLAWLGFFYICFCSVTSVCLDDWMVFVFRFDWSYRRFLYTQLTYLYLAMHTDKTLLLTTRIPYRYLSVDLRANRRTGVYVMGGAKKYFTVSIL